ncbi:DoxX family protein [Larkinella sp.]|uniref:DoxX family protein n=1 Tax=Larkinella sp. TaxID=2034517 RepID=UPI003BABE8DF
MKKTKILYWVFTGLFAFVMLGSSIPDILVIPQAVEGFKQISLPAYLLPFLGWAKLLGVIAILVPGFPRIKEWAYAGLIFDLLGATYCVYSAGKTPMDWAPMLVFVALGAASYVFYHKKQATATFSESGNQNSLRAVLG